MVDISRSMYRKDILGNRRLHWALTALRDIINKKKEADSNDRYSIILFSNKDYIIDDFVYNFDGIKQFIYENGEISGYSHFPLDKAVKRIIDEKRKIGQKVFRVVIISDGRLHPTIENPIKIAKLAADLGIICDAIRFGQGMISGNLIKRIVEITGGKYHLITSEKDIQEAIQKISEKKKLKASSLFDDGKSDDIDSLAKDIASPLLKIEDMTDKQQSKINFGELKCSICHSEKCLICETSFYGCGRFCPNCFKPIHLHCAIKWSDCQQETNSCEEDFKVLRCPFCYYLLKIPITVHRQVVKDVEGENVIRRTTFSEEARELMTSICSHSECGILFDESVDEYVYKCDACNAYFHSDCFEKFYAREKKCPSCRLESEVIDG